MEKQIREVIVVEGNHDKAKVHEVFPQASILITNGKEISQETLDSLKTLNEQRGLILLLDPDVPGEAIRKTINAYVGDTLHAFIPKHQCIDTKKRKVGIEHASKQTIRQALMDHVHSTNPTEAMISKQALIKRGLIGAKDSKLRREKVIDAYNMGLCNGKTFHKKINMFNITLTMIDAVIE